MGPPQAYVMLYLNETEGKKGKKKKDPFALQGTFTGSRDEDMVTLGNTTGPTL